MSVQDQVAAQLVLDRMAVPDIEHTYVLGSFASPVTFSSQQFRAFNLVWALFKTKRLTEGDSVAVIGGGLAGITAAAAAVLKRCKVTLIERASQTLHLQRGNFTRYVHPNILRWPEPGSDVSTTDFPFLNWHAGTVDDVVAQLESQWSSIASKVELLLGYDVDSISSGRWPSVKANRIYGEGPALHHDSYKCVIIAAGFGPEQSRPGVRFLSYWDNDSLHREIAPSDKIKRFLVSGCGDGGLIDALRLRLQNFKHEQFVSEFFSSSDVQPIKDELLKIEEEFKGTLPTEDVGLKIYQKYKNLPLTKNLEKKISSRLRPDTHVTLNSPQSNPLSLRSSILNRFATFLLITYGSLHYEEGLINVEPHTDEFVVTFTKTGGGTSSKNFDEIIVRHGPQSVIDRLLTQTSIEYLSKMWSHSADPTAQKIWEDNFFPTAISTTLAIPAKIIDTAVQQFRGAFSLLYDPQHVRLIGVGNFAGKSGYVIQVKQGHSIPDPQIRTSIGAIPVMYYEEESSNPLLSSSLLEVGSEIFNYDANQREGGDFLNGIGTLGYFVKLKSGGVGIISTNVVLAQEGFGKVGDIIARPAGGLDGVSYPIAELHSFINIEPSPSTEIVASNKVDAALAILNPNVEYRVGFPERLGLPNIKGWGKAQVGDKVFKLGRTTGLTHGTVTAVAVDMPIIYQTGEYWFSDVFDVEAEDDKPFSAAGDGGALVVRDDGIVLGMLNAGGGQHTYVCLIEDVLNLLDCELLIED